VSPVRCELDFVSPSTPLIIVTAVKSSNLLSAMLYNKMCGDSNGVCYDNMKQIPQYTSRKQTRSAMTSRALLYNTMWNGAVSSAGSVFNLDDRLSLRPECAEEGKGLRP
jgi:hypothetical protein